MADLFIKEDGEKMTAVTEWTEARGVMSVLQGSGVDERFHGAKGKAEEEKAPFPLQPCFSLSFSSPHNLKEAKKKKREQQPMGLELAYDIIRQK